MQKEIWIFVEIYNNSIERVSLELLGVARRMAEENNWLAAAIVVGAGISHEVTQKLSQYGAKKIYILDNEKFCYYQSELFTHILTRLAKERRPQIILMGATPNGNDLASRIAARLRVGFVSDCTDLTLNKEKRLVLSKAILDGKTQASFTTVGTPQIATVCPDVIGLENAGPVQPVPVEHIQVTWEESPHKSRVLQFIKCNHDAIDIAEADIIVAGGRGVGGKDKWPAIEKLADAIGGAVAGSRMAKDMGCISRDRLVGQTGKSVKPKLYLALGISGSCHHISGLKEAEKVIVINKDRQAPFVKQADLAVIADLHQLLQELNEMLAKYSTEGKFNK